MRTNSILSLLRTAIFSVVLCVCLGAVSEAQTYSQLHSFPGTSSDGYAPAADLVLGGNTLYGTTPSGGRGGNGTVFSINTDGSAYTVIKNFTNTDGANPQSGLVLDNGVLYGTTQSGGGAFQSGTVFKVNTNGSGFMVIKSFPAMNPTILGTNSDGAQPHGTLVSDGKALFGTASMGGVAGSGTIFKINLSDWGFTVLKTFPPTFQGTNNVSGNILVHGTNVDGARPAAGLLLAGSTLYGTTFYGGMYSNGVVFKIDTDGSGFAVIKCFSGLICPPGMPYGTNSDGANPRAALALSGDTLYGMTVNGGSLYDGTIFKLKTNGTDFAVLKNYYNADGAWPYNALLVDGQTLYGSTVGGGTTNKGVVFKTFIDGSNYTVLKNLNPVDGFYCYSRLVLSSNKLFGTTYYGGTNNGGVVFSLTVPPQILAGDGNFGVQSDGFGFNMTGVSNQAAVVEACTDLLLADWLPIQTNTLNGGSIYFNDPGWTNYSGRLYRLHSP
jgi:uncharacterized repeat protein (TIGR03803 family)